MSKTVIVGVGALGSHVAMLLRNESDLTVVDFDRIEQKNTLAQLHGVGAIGKNKAESMKQLMQFIWGLKVKAIPHKLTGDNAHHLLEPYDLIIDCVDNGAARRLIQSFVQLRQPASMRWPCLHGALAPDGQFGRVVWDENFKVDDEDGVGAATCESGEHLPYISIVSSYIAKAAQHFLKTGRKIGFEINPGGVIST